MKVFMAVLKTIAVINILAVSTILAEMADKSILICRMYTSLYTIGYIKEVDLVTLEPPKYNDNARNDMFSCIAEGSFVGKFQKMATWGEKDYRILLFNKITRSSYEIFGTNGRNRGAIFIHEGHVLNATRGCILVGKPEDMVFTKELFGNIKIRSYDSSLEALGILERFLSKDKIKEKKLFNISIIEDSSWYEEVSKRFANEQEN